MTTPTAVAASAGRADDGRPAVLVVEEAGAAPDAAADLARRLGYRVTAASGMLDGLAALRERQFAVVLLDLALTGIGAVEGLRRLRSQAAGRGDDGIGDTTRHDAGAEAEPAPQAGGEVGGTETEAEEGGGFATAGDVPVIALTPAGQAMDGERLRELGFDDHLAKPFQASRLRAMLNQHLAPTAGAADRRPGLAAASTPAVGGATAPPAAVAEVLDGVALARLGELDPTGRTRLVERVLQAFQNSAARLRQEAVAARAGDDRKVLQRVAHTLKSSSASIGANRLSQLCAELEASIRTGRDEPLGSQLDALDQALDEVLRSIAERLKGLP